MTEPMVKTGFLIPKSVSERAQAVAKANGVSMRSLLAGYIEQGVALSEAAATVPTPVVLDTSSTAPIDGVPTPDVTATNNLRGVHEHTTTVDDASFFMGVVKSQIPVPTSTPTALPRHRPTKSGTSSWRFK